MKYRIGLLSIIGILILVAIIFPQNQSNVPDDVRVEFWNDTLDIIYMTTTNIYDGKNFTDDEKQVIVKYIDGYHNDLSEQEAEIMMNTILISGLVEDYYNAVLNKDELEKTKIMREYETQYQYFKAFLNN